MLFKDPFIMVVLEVLEWERSHKHYIDFLFLIITTFFKNFLV